MRDKPIVLTDVDGVAAGFDSRVVEVCAENGWELDIDHPSKQIHRYFTDHVVLKHHRNMLRKHIDTTPFFADLDLIEGAQEGIRALALECEVWFCSKPLDNNVSCASDKMAWIKRHFPKLKDRLILAGDKSLVMGDILLDDAPKLKWFDRAVWEPIIYTQPFNSHISSEYYGMPHYSWDEPIDKLINWAYAAKEEREFRWKK